MLTFSAILMLRGEGVECDTNKIVTDDNECALDIALNTDYRLETLMRDAKGRARGLKS